MKSVLLHVQDDDCLEARLQAALAIVRASGGHLHCFHVMPVGLYPDGFGISTGFILGDVLEHAEEQEAALRQRLEEQLGSEDVAWSYEKSHVDPTQALVSRGALADVIVLGRARHKQSPGFPVMTMFGDLLRASRTPLLVYPDDQERFDPLGPALVAWNGTIEASNALRAALPLLKLAESVHVLSVDEAKGLDFPALGASQYLSQHGVHAERSTSDAGGREIDEVLVATARKLGASYMVMGAYGHSRAREYVFGGVTRNLLKHCPLPILMSH